MAFLLFLSSCSSTRKIKINFKVEAKNKSDFKGFVLYNPKTKDELINYNGHTYFTPASNTKLLTFYTAFRTFKDSVPGLEFYETKDSLIIKGTANPSFNYGFNDTKILEFLKNTKLPIYLINAAIDEPVYGSGWAWDDYSFAFMPEKNLFPVSGNVVTYQNKNNVIQSNPAYFKSFIKLVESNSKTREVHSNLFYLLQKSDKIQKTPFVTSNQVVKNVLEEISGKSIQLVPPNKNYTFIKLYVESYSNLYKKLLIDSDNFIAEQLLLQVGKEVANTYNVQKAIDYSLANYLYKLPQKPRWVDGSGLSRYNLISPKDMVFVLEQLYNEIPFPELITYFPQGGISGTLQNQFKSTEPYIFAKTGTLSNNYNLSGFLKTKKGTILIFSYMNNHFLESTTQIKSDIEKTLQNIYLKY